MSAFDFINSPRVLNLRLLYNDLARLARTSSATKSSTPADVKPAGIIRRSPSVGDGQQGSNEPPEHASNLMNIYALIPQNLSPDLRQIVVAVDCARAALADATCPVPATPESGRLAHRRTAGLLRPGQPAAAAFGPPLRGADRPGTPLPGRPARLRHHTRRPKSLWATPVSIQAEVAFRCR